MPDSKPIISIIIPCYNSGNYLPDAIESVKRSTDQNLYEIIIIDDGSTDQKTIALLNLFKTEGITVLHQKNQGPAAARNTGVKEAKGEYLLFLDSDNKIKSSYIDKGVAILSANPEVGVVYSNPVFFGGTKVERFKTKRFDNYSILLYNYIDMCSVVRKKTWQDLGGFDEERILIGHEDWEFWIRVGAANWKFYHIDEILFEYRLRDDSVINKAMQPDKQNQMLNYVHLKHRNLFMENYYDLYMQSYHYEEDKQRPIRSFIKFTYNKYLKR